jgi:(p)ppGpp synthase/HD superfamily hydrolase
MNPHDFIKFCIERHDVFANQKYDDTLPYSAHLRFVAAQYYKFSHLLRDKDNITCLLACYGHDLIEDTRLTYNDIVNKTTQEIADIIYCCTEEKGRNRDERHSDKYYKELSQNKLAIFVKLCDILANVQYSILTNSSMFKKHKKENEKNQKLKEFAPEFEPMFNLLNTLFND